MRVVSYEEETPRPRTAIFLWGARSRTPVREPGDSQLILMKSDAICRPASS
jgi:hypothetical protein